MALVAIENFYTIDRLLDKSPNETFGGVVAELGRAQARDFMRYLSSELNRLFFQLWNFAQLGIAGLSLWLVYSIEPRHIRRGVAVMLLLVVILAIGLTPGILSIGRALDFVGERSAAAGIGDVRVAARGIHSHRFCEADAGWRRGFLAASELACCLIVFISENGSAPDGGQIQPRIARIYRIEGGLSAAGSFLSV